MAKLSDFDFKSNPFEAALGGQPSPAPSLGAPQALGGLPTSPQDAGLPAGAFKGTDIPGSGPQQTTPQIQSQLPLRETQIDPEASEQLPEINQFERGQNPTKSNHLMKAMTALEAFVTDSTNKTDIMFARGLMTAMSRLIGRDQEELGTQAQAAEPTPAPLLNGGPVTPPPGAAI